MIVGTLMCACRLPAVTSLKSKRRIIKSIVTRIRNRHNVSIAEVDTQDRLQLATIGVAAVANTKRRTEQELNHVLKWLDREHELEVISVETWFG